MISGRSQGPLLWVTSRAEHADAFVDEVPRASPLEILSLNNEVHRLMACIDVLSRHQENRLNESKEAHSRELQDLANSHAAESKLRREEFRSTINSLQAENAKLRERLDTLSSCGTRLDSLETESEQLRRKLLDQESSWTELLKTKEAQWQRKAEEHNAHAQVQDEKINALLSSLQVLEATLRQTVSEKEVLEQCVAQEPQRWQQAVAEVNRQVQDKDAALQDIRRRNGTLEALLNELQRNEAVRDVAIDERVALLQQELANEKKRNAEVVGMYCGQIDHLHQQLEASMAKNKLLLQELQRERQAAAR